MTKGGILGAGLWALAVVVLFVGAVGGFALCLLHKFNSDPTAGTDHLSECIGDFASIEHHSWRYARSLVLTPDS